MIRKRNGSKIAPALRALFVQIAAFLLVFAVLAPLFERIGLHAGFIALALLQGVFAALFSMNQEKWWMVIQLAFLPMLATVSSFHVDPRWFLWGFFLLALVFWNAYGTRVPLYLSGRAALEEISRRLPEGEFSFADLGSGIGSVVAGLARARPDGKFLGVEIAPLPFLIGRARCLGLANCTMKWGSFEKIDLSGYDVVYAFLSPVPMPMLFEKARREMKPGSTFVSNSFTVPGAEADEVFEMRGKRLYFWKM